MEPRPGGRGGNPALRLSLCQPLSEQRSPQKSSHRPPNHWEIQEESDRWHPLYTRGPRPGWLSRASCSQKRANTHNRAHTRWLLAPCRPRPPCPHPGPCKRFAHRGAPPGKPCPPGKSSCPQLSKGRDPPGSRAPLACTQAHARSSLLPAGALHKTLRLNRKRACPHNNKDGSSPHPLPHPRRLNPQNNLQNQSKALPPASVQSADSCAPPRTLHQSKKRHAAPDNSAPESPKQAPRPRRLHPRASLPERPHRSLLHQGDKPLHHREHSTKSLAAAVCLQGAQ